MNVFKLKAIFYKLQAPYYKLLLSSSLDGSDEFFGRSRDFISRLAATGEGTAGTDGVDDVVDVITRHAVFLAVGRADIRPVAAAHLDDDGLDAALQVVPGNVP